MIPHKLNRKLLKLALVGVVLYFSAGILPGIINREAVQEDTDASFVEKESARQIAIDFVGDKFGYSVSEADLVYQTDKHASGYVASNSLEQEYQENFADKIPLDYWLVIVRGGAGEPGVWVHVDMADPAVRSWEVTGAEPELVSSETLAVAWQAMHDAGYAVDEFTYLSSGGSAMFDHTFQLDSATLGAAALTVTVEVADGVATALIASLDIPESYLQWIGSQEKIASYMTIAFVVLTVVLGIVALVLALVHAKTVNWSRGILMTVIFMILYYIHNMNLAEAMMLFDRVDTSGDPIFDIVMVVLVIVTTIMMGVAVWFSFLSGDQQWRKMGLNLWPRWREPEFGKDIFYGMGRGYLLCFFIMGMQQMAFLLAGYGFDMFMINDPAQSTYNMAWPSLFPSLAWVASIMEESIYRLFAIALFLRMFRYRFPAILLASIIWGLGHTSYTIYPSYTRLLEVTLLGVIFGYALIKYGMMTVIFAHAIMNSLLMSVYLVLEDPTLSNLLLALLYISLPAIIGYVVRYLHPRYGGHRRRMLPDDDPANASLNDSPYHTPDPRLVP